MIKSIITASCAAGALYAAALAGDDTEAYAFTLDVSEIGSEEGRQAVYADIKRQAVRFCAYHARSPRNDARTAAACRASLVANAIRTADDVRLAALYEAESDRRFIAAP